MRTNETSKKKSKKKLVIHLVSAVVLVLALFLLVFALYDTPAKYVPTADGEIYLDASGEPILYYEDLFGRTFYVENGKRLYAAVPACFYPSSAQNPDATPEENTVKS